MIRSINYYDNFLFPHDQARDAQRIWSIINEKDIKLVGPETDLQGVFNGPFFYYLLVPIYGFSNFDPNPAVLFFILLNSSIVFLIYYTTNILFSNKLASLLAALFWALSFEQTNYSRFISNATLMAPASIIFFLGLALYFIKKKWYGIYLSIFGFAMAVQVNFYLIYLGIYYIIFFFIYRNKFSFTTFLKSLILALILLSSFIISELKWGFNGTQSLFSFLLSHQTNSSVTDSFTRYIERVSQSFYYSFSPFNNFFSFILLVSCLIITYSSVKKRKEIIFLYIWIFSTLPLFAFNIQVINTLAINQTILPSLTILLGLTLSTIILSKYYKIIGIALTCFMFATIINYYIQHEGNFTSLISDQPLIYADEKNLIDYVYNDSKNEKFSICALSNPLFINTIWSHLFNTYGKNTYKRLPYWAGQKQSINENNLPYDELHVPLRYLIFEPSFALIKYSKEATIYLEDHKSDLKEQKSFGNLLVQKRILRKKDLFIDSQKLNKNDLEGVYNLVHIEPRFSCFTEYR